MMECRGERPYYEVHRQAYVDDTVTIGEGTKIWQFASIIRGARIGKSCTVASGATIDGSEIGDRCIVCHNVAMGPGFWIGDDVFIGPNVTLCNDAWPSTSKKGWDIEEIRKSQSIIVKNHASIGAGAVILPGVVIGVGAVVAANATVTRDAPSHSLWRRDGRIQRLGWEDKPLTRMKFAR